MAHQERQISLATRTPARSRCRKDGRPCRRSPGSHRRLMFRMLGSGARWHTGRLDKIQRPIESRWAWHTSFLDRRAGADRLASALCADALLKAGVIAALAKLDGCSVRQCSTRVSQSRSRAADERCRRSAQTRCARHGQPPVSPSTAGSINSVRGKAGSSRADNRYWRSCPDRSERPISASARRSLIL